MNLIKEFQDLLYCKSVTQKAKLIPRDFRGYRIHGNFRVKKLSWTKIPWVLIFVVLERPRKFGHVKISVREKLASCHVNCLMEAEYSKNLTIPVISHLSKDIGGSTWRISVM